MGAALFLSLIAVALVLAFFLGQGRRRDGAWERYRERIRQRRQRPRLDEPPDPNFQFDSPPADPPTGNPQGPSGP
jgi:hypothetical protein